MKYKEACACGATMNLETERPTEMARAKSQWTIDHGPHGDNTMTIERKRLLLEHNDMMAKVKAIENEPKHPAMVQAFDMVVVDRINGDVVYRAVVSPGEGFYWEDPKSSFTVALAPTTMNLPDLENKALIEAEAKAKVDPKTGVLPKKIVNPSVPHADHVHVDATKSFQAFKKQYADDLGTTMVPPGASKSTLAKTVDTMGEKPPPPESVLNPAKDLSKRLGKAARQAEEKLIFGATTAISLAHEDLDLVPPFRVITSKEFVAEEDSREQGQQDESKRDDGAKTPKRVATRSRIRRGDMGRRGDK